MVLDPMSMRARGRGPSEGLLRTPSAGTHKKEIFWVSKGLQVHNQRERYF